MMLLVWCSKANVLYCVLIKIIHVIHYLVFIDLISIKYEYGSISCQDWFNADCSHSFQTYTLPLEIWFHIQILNTIKIIFDSSSSHFYLIFMLLAARSKLVLNHLQSFCLITLLSELNFGFLSRSINRILLE